MANVGNWTVESCSTSGTGDLTLVGTSTGYARFQDSIPAGQVWYAIEDGNNREAGIGTFDGASTITRDDVKVTLVNGVYNDTNPTSIDLSGESTVGCTFNKSAYDELIADVADYYAHKSNTSNPHNVTVDQVGAEPDLGNPAIDGYVLSSDTAGNRSWIEMAAGGSSTFLDLTDTPADYTGQAGKIVLVNGTEDALEFGSVSGGDMLKAVYDTDDNGIVDNSELVNGLAVETAVPPGAVFTDTTDHTALTNIGTNTHAQIDTHIADGSVHYPQTSISITESQISDLDKYTQAEVDSLVATKEDDLGLPASNGQVLSSDTSGNRSWVDQSGGIPGYKDIGAYGSFANKTLGAVHPNNTVTGLSLRFAGVSAGGVVEESTVASPPGTWRCQGYASVDGVTTFMRIA